MKKPQLSGNGGKHFQTHKEGMKAGVLRNFINKNNLFKML